MSDCRVKQFDCSQRYLEDSNVSLQGSLRGCHLGMLGLHLLPELVARLYGAAQPVVGSLQALGGVLQGCLQPLYVCIGLRATVFKPLNHLVL